MPEYDDTFDHPVKYGLPFHGTVQDDALKLNVPDQPTTPISAESFNAGTLETVKLTRNPDTSQAHTLTNAAPLHQTQTYYEAGAYIKDSYGWVYTNTGSAGSSSITAPDFASSNYGDVEPDGDQIKWTNLGEYVPDHTHNYLLTKFGVYFVDSSTNNGMPQGMPLTIDYTPLAGTYLRYYEHWDGSVHVIKSPAAHAVTTTTDETAEGKEWREYTLMTARESIIGGKALGPGSWIYIDPDENPWIVNMEASKNDGANSVTLTLKLVRLFGRADLANGYSYKAMNTVLDTVTYTGTTDLQTHFYTDSSVNVHIGATNSMGISPDYTGTHCFFNVYSVRDTPITYPPLDGSTIVNFGVYLGSVGGVAKPVPSNAAIYPGRLLGYFSVDITGSGNIVPDASGNYGGGIIGTITWQASRETFDNDPNYAHYPHDTPDAYLKLKRVYANNSATWIDAVWENYVIDQPDPYPTADVNGTYVNFTYSANGTAITIPYASMKYLPSLINPTMVKRFQGTGATPTGIEAMYMDGSNTTFAYSLTRAYSYQPETASWYTADNDQYVNWA